NIGGYSQPVVLIDIVLHPKIKAVTVFLIVVQQNPLHPVSYLLSRCIIPDRKLAVIDLPRSKIIATGDLYFLSPHIIIVHAKGIGGNDAIGAAPTPASSTSSPTAPGCLANGKVRHINIISEPHKGHFTIVIEYIKCRTNHVALISSVACRYLA